MLGSPDKDARKKAEIRGHCQSLVTLGHVRFRQVETEGKNEWLYEITASGKKALQNA